jgi:YD repeat-containing protein
MPYDIVKRGDEYCVVSDEKTHGCHESRADAIKQQRALYKNAPPEDEAAGESASSEAVVTMTPVDKRIQVKDVALLQMALQRSGAQDEEATEAAVLTAAGLADPEVAAQTVALIGHLADRLKTAELNQAALVDVLQAVAADSTASRSALLEALNGISERLAEAPPVNITVPVPDVHVNVEQAGKRVVELERDSSGKLIGATTGTRTIELERDSSGKLVGATVEEEGADRNEEAA